MDEGAGQQSKDESAYAETGTYTGTAWKSELNAATCTTCPTIVLCTTSSSSEASAYRYGFNGKEKDNMGASTYDYGFRIYNPEIAKFLSVDPLTSSYPWYTPYQFAGNMPISAIDIDGLEPGVVIGGKDQVQAVNNAKGNENYTAFELVDLDQTIDQVKKHIENGNKITVMYLQSHGTDGNVALGPGPDKVFNTEAVQRGSSYRNDDVLINASNIEFYNQMTPEDLVTFKNDSKVIAIQKFQKLVQLTEKNATIILGACHAARNENGTNDGDRLVSAVAGLTNRKVIMSENYVSATMPKKGRIGEKFLDRGRIHESDFDGGRGWNISEAFDATSLTNPTLIEKTGRNLRLNSKGNMYDFIIFRPRQKNE